ncbi:MAG: hypothetical protein KDB27_32825 [Planctomycetales bacterium]|nr:hypothetical protein [Planctomycetales bacterium]
MKNLFRSLLLASIAFVLIYVPASTSLAIVIVPSGSGNAVAPTDDPGWLNVANRGVYIGNRWMLSVEHVGAGQTVFQDVGTFEYEAGTEIRLANPTGVGISLVTDLVMYRLQTDPGLPSLKIAPTGPTVGTDVTMIADGGLRDGNLVNWDVTEVTPTDWVWTQVASSGDYSGYNSFGTGKRWATNVVSTTTNEDSSLNEVNSGYGDVVSFSTIFDITGGTTNEGQAAIGDSGGAMFAKDAFGAWQLTGLIHAVSTYEDQPLPGLTALEGNATYSADLSAYSSQIVAISAVPEPTGAVSIFLLVGCATPIVRLRRRP